MTDLRNIAILALLVIIGIMYWMNDKEAVKQSKNIIKLEQINKGYLKRDSIRTATIDTLKAIQDSIRSERDTIYIYITKTDENTRKEIARIDSTPVMQLVRELSGRYK